MKIVELRNVYFQYDKNVILENINLELEEKTFLAIIGPNGSGKTTLLNIISGLKKVSKGEVFVFEKKLCRKNIVEVRKEIGYVAQNYIIDKKLPFLVKDIISLGRYGKVGFFKNLSYEDKSIIEETISFLKIEDLKEKPIGHISSGECQKIHIARVLVQQPKILLLDEPTSSLDPKSQHELLKLVEDIYLKKNITTIFVTHILNHIPSCCNKIILLKNGKIISSGKPDEVLKKDILSNLYTCDVEIEIINNKRHFHIGPLHP
ncbi:MAG: ABC transporter ATP-binding protein [Endomicrobiia bacterium]